MTRSLPPGPVTSSSRAVGAAASRTSSTRCRRRPEPDPLFYDRVTVTVRAGRGGDGSSSFRREAHVPRGGADGGDGGDGGDVILDVDPSRRDLAHLRRRRSYEAQDGGAGARRKRHGKRGEDVIMQVPRGTQATTLDGRRLCDLVGGHERATIAVGGTGGRGNTHFVSPVRQAPAFAEIGLPGDELEIELRLKLMADAALVGVPNAGKSSLLRRITNATPKIGDYPFTTLAPVLGTIERPDGSQLVVVDVPGLLEGASEGHGLGNEFLPHLERAHMLLHTITLDEPDLIFERFCVIMSELWAYDPRIALADQIVVLTKADLVNDDDAQRAVEVVRSAVAAMDGRCGKVLDVCIVSSATGRGLTPFVQSLFRGVAHREDPERSGGRAAIPGGPAVAQELDEYRVYRPRPRRRRWRIFREKDGYFITGDASLRLLAERAAADDDEATSELHELLTSTGAVRALQMAGVPEGTAVTVCGHPFVLV